MKAARGEPSVDAASGKASLDEARGEASVDAAGGKASVDEARGKVSVDEARGKVSVDEARGEVSADGARGEASVNASRIEVRVDAGQRETSAPIGLGLRTVKGGAVVVGVALEHGEPRVVLSTFLATGAEDDRLSLEPFHVAAELERDPQGRTSAAAMAALAGGRKRQDQMAANGLHAIIRILAEARCEPVVAALLVNRAGWITDLLAYSISWPEHVPVAEGLAVRDALRFAIKDCRVELTEIDEKSLPDLATNTLGSPSMAIDARLKALGATVGRPWRKEQKLACLSAWIALTAQRGYPASSGSLTR